MTDQDPPKATEEELAKLRPIRDQLGKYGDLFMRLNGLYWVGPRGTQEPEFGYRDMRQAGLYQTIQVEAAMALADLADATENIMANRVLWCVHVIGPDDVIATKSYEEAVQLAKRMNEAFSRNKVPNITWFAHPSPWPHSNEAHAEEIKKHWGATCA